MGQRRHGRVRAVGRAGSIADVGQHAVLSSNIDLFAILVVAASAYHYDGLTTFIFRIVVVTFGIDAKIHANTVATICLNFFQQHFQIVHAIPAAEGVFFADAIGIMSPGLLLVTSNESVYLL